MEYLLGLDATFVTVFLSKASQDELIRYGFLFLVAAWIHSGRVKKEIRSNFLTLTEAINNIAKALKDDLEKHGKRLDTIEGRVQNLEKTKLN